MAIKIRGRNEGSISRWANGKYRAQISIGNGKRLNRTFRTKEECKNWIRETLNSSSDIDKESSKAAENWTVRGWFSEWLTQAKNLLRPGTLYDYERLTKKVILPALGDVFLNQLNRRQVNAFYHDLMEKQHASVPTVRLIHRILHRGLEAALEVNLISANPAHGANVPKLEDKEMLVLNEPQIWAFLSTVRGHEHEAIYDLAVKTGMREGELLGLKWSDIDFYHGTITIQRQIKRVTGKGLVFAPLKTKSSRRSIHLGENTINLLRVHKINLDALRVEQGNRWQENDLVFPSTIGTPIDQSNLVGEFKAILEVAGLPDIRFHDLRHTAASIMLKHLKDILVVSRTLGHSRASTTLNIYAHLLPGVQAEAAQKIDSVLSPTAIGGLGQPGMGAAVKAEVEAGMNLGWRHRRPPTRSKKAVESINSDLH